MPMSTPLPMGTPLALPHGLGARPGALDADRRVCVQDKVPCGRQQPAFSTAQGRARGYGIALVVAW